MERGPGDPRVLPREHLPGRHPHPPRQDDQETRPQGRCRRAQFLGVEAIK